MLKAEHQFFHLSPLTPIPPSIPYIGGIYTLGKWSATELAFSLFSLVLIRIGKN